MTESLFRRARRAVLGLVIIPCMIGCSKHENGSVAKTSSGPLAFRQGCGRCHLPPDPRAHRVDEWPRVVMRMQQHMATQGKAPLTVEQRAEILDYLSSHALGAS